MVKDPDNRYIEVIRSVIHLEGKDVLEIGCGDGRISRDLAAYAGRLVAVDTDPALLERAARAVGQSGIEFVAIPSGLPEFAENSFDVVIYTLSLHHVHPHRMRASLARSARLLRAGGVLAVLEPGDGGAFTEAKERFGAGSGDERPQREAALAAVAELEGWRERERILFRTGFLFRDEGDFLEHMLPGYALQPDEFLSEVRRFLEGFGTPEGILLEADRCLIVLERVD